VRWQHVSPSFIFSNPIQERYLSYLLYGQNAFLIDERIAALRAEIDPQQLSTTVIDIQASSLPEIVAASQALPFFGGQRLVILLNPIAPRRGGSDDDAATDEADNGRVKWADLSSALKSAPASTTFILRHVGSLAAGHYVRKATKAMGWTDEEQKLEYGDNLLAWVSQRAQREGYRLDSDAAVELLNRLHPMVWNGFSRFNNDVPDPTLIATEVAKLASAAVDGVVGVEAVCELVADRAGFQAFKLNEVMFAGNVDGALVELQQMLEAGEAPERIVGGFGSEAAARSAARHAREYGAGAVAAAIGTTEGRVSMLAKRGAPTSQSAHRRVAEAIRYADWAVKNGRADRTSATITPLVAEIAEAVHRSSGPSRERF
jgi:DNA polymerase III delta subunit